MHPPRHHIVVSRCLIALCTALLATSAIAAAPTFVVTVDPAIRQEPFTGRVYVFFASTNPQPRTGPDWFHPEPFIAKEISDLKPGEPVRFSADDPAVLAFPKPLADLELTGLKAQAVARFNPLERQVGTGPGNGYGATISFDNGADEVGLAIDRLIEARPYEETRWGKLIDVPSKLLSDFHGRKVTLRGTVILPASYYDQPQRRYPTILTIPGFGGDHRIDPVREPVPEQNEAGVEFLRVMLDPNCSLGHHTFADSDNNGPVGEAFITEFLPAFDREYRSIGEPTARFVTGHSSGGWSSL